MIIVTLQRGGQVVYRELLARHPVQQAAEHRPDWTLEGQRNACMRPVSH